MDDNVRPMPPRQPRPNTAQSQENWRRWRTRIITIAIPLVLIIGALLRFWVDILWFHELGQRDVLMTRLQWGTVMGVSAGIVTFAMLQINFMIARKVARNDLYVPFLAAPVTDGQTPEQPVVPHYVVRPIMLGVSAVVAVLAGLAMSSNWEVILRFMGRTNFGVSDPHFGKDASFYVFTMPLLELIARSLQVLVVLSIIGVVIAYVATGVIRYLPALRIARSATLHLSILAASFLLVSALQYRISIWHLATSTTGVVAGAGWTDTHARIPGYWVMIGASILLAFVTLWFARKERWRIVGGAVATWVVASVIVTGIIPSLVQSVLVEPNELDREKQVLSGNIKNTRAAYDLEKIRSVPFEDEANLSRKDLLETNTATTENIRLWSPDVLGSIIQQMQSLRRYYTFNDVDVDRYTVDGRYRQVMVAVRELDPSSGTVAQSWTNQRLVYTHGYGAVATWPNEVSRQGQPEYLLKNLQSQPVGQNDIKIKRPEVYFGEAPENQVIVGTKQAEVSPRGVIADEENSENGAGANDANTGDDSAKDKDAADAKTHYEGKGGIPINSMGRRIAFAATFGDSRVLFTDQLTKKSRVIFRRNIHERVSELAPFLTLDQDPYAVIIDGRIKWIVDAYTTSDRFPYSETVELGTDARGGGGTRVNYVRNSVKAVVDAYDGDVQLYVADEKDPILAAWRNIFPKLFVSMDKMSDELRAHLRYPEDLFKLQTDRWRRYHMKTVSDFYASEDLWEVPQLSGVEMQPFYVLAKLPGEKQAEMLLIRPLTPATKKNMIAYMVARSDGEQYGDVITYQLPTQTLTQGPSQVQALIRQDSDIAEQVRLWESNGNNAIFGNLLVLPVERSLLYVQPVYLKNEEAEIPEFQRIVVVLGDTVAWGSTFEQAVADLLAKRGQSGETTSPGGTGDTGSGSANTGTKPGSGGTKAGSRGSSGARRPSGSATNTDFGGLSEAELQSVLADVSAAYDRALECQRSGDWACYGKELNSIEALLNSPKASDKK